ncbi:MAG TPA: sugar ABC transporter permease [Gaiellaceae bacterium]|jgi:alpha-glucoside transport system permease protein|nr:sugar ABC transporter permease [Gaiellaceae bacterium]
MTRQLADLVLGVTLIPLGLFAYLVATERVVGVVERVGRGRLRAWVWLAPPLALIVGVLVYPLAKTLYLSFFDASSSHYVGARNYRAIFSDPALVSVLKVNLIWVVFFPLGAVSLGLLTALLLDRVRYEKVAKAIIAMPTAVSFVAGSVMWRLIYTYNAPGTPQIGTLNAALQALVPGFVPRAWLVDSHYNNYALVFVGIWMGTGLATLILSAALKGVPHELIEAARIDGANEWHVFRIVILPELIPALAVVTTVSVIAAIKVFDIVYVMTGGNYNTDVVATRMYSEQFASQNTGLACAIAIVLLLAVTPVLIANRGVLRREEQL